MTASREPGAIGTSSPAYSSSTAIMTVGEQRHERRQTLAERGPQVGDRRSVRKLDLELGPPGPILRQGEEPNVHAKTESGNRPLGSVAALASSRRSAGVSRSATISGLATSSSTTEPACCGHQCVDAHAGGQRMDLRRRSSRARRSDGPAGRCELGMTMRSGILAAYSTSWATISGRDPGIISGRQEDAIGASSCRASRLESQLDRIAHLGGPRERDDDLGPGASGLGGDGRSFGRIGRRRDHDDAPGSSLAERTDDPADQALAVELRRAAWAGPSVRSSRRRERGPRSCLARDAGPGTSAGRVALPRTHHENGPSRPAGPGCGGRSARPRC